MTADIRLLSRSLCRPSGFTLIEVLAAIGIIAIVLPVLMHGVSLAATAASVSRHRSHATALAQSKLNELVLSGEWQKGIVAGDFESDPDYHWSASANLWNSPTVDGLTTTLQQLDVAVTWSQQGQQRKITLSTLIYQNASGDLLP